jgi:hypothetical protein
MRVLLVVSIALRPMLLLSLIALWPAMLLVLPLIAVRAMLVASVRTVVTLVLLLPDGALMLRRALLVLILLAMVCGSTAFVCG